MAIIKCKMCGGDLNIVEGATVAECEYCGSKQTIPNQDNEKKLTLFARAERLRRACEFDKAAGVYESIVAEFPEEAEAYWGLVLCRYGIEYVDDPATGKKVPTCHRSSFDSILEDADFDQACENADAIARRLYREEAKTIEDIRRGILEVSSKEEPYDIFICYKETDETGGRTIDSVIAQDVYDALTEKGYRVFFSRISLEDKLGSEYEPYIFAALNSAKIMLAFGTDFEYFNAVWVKNEWSRFLALMAAGQKKTLIPCYKGIDAYDMPKEFQRLQAQDMGKVGAIQDLLRGIGKIIPKEAAPAATASSASVVPGVESLLKRGYMALEDSEWKRADDFFEQALNLDAECSEGYLGKFLAQRKYSSAKQMISQEKQVKTPAKGKRLEACPADAAFIAKVVEELQIPQFLTEKAIRTGLDKFNRIYESIEDARQREFQQKEQTLAGDKLFSKALRYDRTGQVNQAQKEILDAYQTRITEGRQQDQASQDRIAQEYAAFLKSARQKIEEQHTATLKKLSADYAEAFKEQEDAENTSKESGSGEKRTAAQLFLSAASKFRKLGPYQDSHTRAELCSREAEQLERDAEQLERDAEQLERQRQKAERNAFIAKMQPLWKPLREATQVAVNTWNTVGLRADGTVVAVGRNSSGECDVTGWADIVAVAVGNEHTVGLRADGTVVAMGSNSDGQCDMTGWTDIVAVACGTSYTVGLKSDGTVVATGNNLHGRCDVSGWRNIVAVSAGISHTVALRADGTVVAVGKNDEGQCDVSGWRDIVAVTTGSSCTVGLQAGGTVVAVGKYGKGQGDVTGWRNIVAVTAGNGYTVGLRADGTVVAMGSNSDGQCNVSGWRNIVAVAAGNGHTVGLRADGTVVATGYNGKGQCNVTDWKLFDDVETMLRERAQAKRQAKISALNNEKQSLQTELANLKGLFSGGKRRQIEARLAEIEAELKKL